VGRFGLTVEPCPSRPGGVGLGLEMVEPCRSRPGGVGLGLELVEPCRSRPGGVGLGLIGFSRKYRRERNVIIKKE
jgi:hypothetical protein